MNDPPGILNILAVSTATQAGPNPSSGPGLEATLEAGTSQECLTCFHVRAEIFFLLLTCSLGTFPGREHIYSQGFSLPDSAAGSETSEMLKVCTLGFDFLLIPCVWL